MSRIATAVVVVCLLGGTAAAFAVTEGLKLERSPITAVNMTNLFSPRCGCSTRKAQIALRLRKSDRIRLEVIGGSDVVRTLIEGRRFHRGWVHFTWNGRDDAGRVVAEGVYHARVHLTGQHRTIQLPNDIRVDTTAPTIQIVSVRPQVFSPDGDRRADTVVIGYRTSEPAHALLYVDGKLRVRTRRQLERSSVTWYGRIDGRSLPAGVYALSLAAEDRAGNVGRKAGPAEVRIRYVELARAVLEAKAGTRFGIRVSTDARRLDWRLGRRRGEAKAGLLVLRAPGKPGRVALVVEASGHAARAVVIVRPR